MSIEERTRLIINLDKLVGSKVWGNAQCYADKLGISRATFFRLVEYMREELKAPLRYNSEENKYEYAVAGRLHFGFLETAELPREEQRTTSGGYVINGEIIF